MKVSKKDQKIITNALAYGQSMLGIPYRWYISGEIKGDDQFWAVNKKAPTADKIKKDNKSIVCTGLTNLMRRFVGTKIPGLAPLEFEKSSKGFNWYKEGLTYPGTTGIWFEYLNRNEWLDEIDLEEEYPIGTLLIKSFESIYGDQGHVAIVWQHGKTKKLKDCYILHAAAIYGISQKESIKKNIIDVGEVTIQPYFIIQQYWSKKGRATYFTHVSNPVHWLLDKD